MIRATGWIEVGSGQPERRATVVADVKTFSRERIPDDKQEFRVRIPVDVRSTPYDFRETLVGWAREHGEGANWATFPYASSFRSLSKFTANIDELPLSRIHDHLVEQRFREGEYFEVIGLKIPADSVLNYGVWVLAAIHLYFLIHLRQLRRVIVPGDRAWKTAWHCLYDDNWARLAIVFSVLLLPVASCVLLFVRSVPRFSGVFTIINFTNLAILIFIAVCVACFRELSRIRAARTAI